MNPTSIIRVFGKSKLGRRFTGITLMFLSVLLGIMVYTTTTIQKEETNAVLIDITGRQRMLFQKHLNEIFLTSRGITTDYTSTRELLRSTLNTLMEGGSVVLDPETGKRQTIPAVPTEEILIRLREQGNHLDKIIELTDDFLLQAPNDPAFSQNLKTLRAQNSTLIGIADKAVKLLNRHSESNMTTMMKWESITAFFVALLGIFATSQGIRASRNLENEIAERNRAEKRLRNNEMFLNSIVENIPDMIFVKDAQDLRFLRFNQAGEELVGYPKEAMIGKTDYDFFPKSEADFYTTKDREVLAGKTLLDIPEEVIQTKSQGTRYLHTKKIPILDDQGTPQYLLGISEDITEQKLAKLEHTQREVLLRLIFETGPGCIKRVAADGTLLHMNPAGLSLIEAEEENEALGLSVFDLVVPEHRGAFKQMHQNVLEGEPQTLQFEIQGLKGGRRWMETYAVPFSNPLTNEVEQLAVTHDITDRKTSEERANQLSRQNELILSSAGDGIYGVNLQGQTTFVNPAGAKLLGYPPQELLGRSMHTAIHHTKADGSPYPQEECPMYAAFTGGTIHTVEDEVLWRKDGTSFPVDYSSTPIWQEGKLAGAVVTFRDVTERKQAEKVLQESEERFRLLNETIPQQVWTARPDGSLDYVNQRVLQYFDCSFEDIIGQGWQRFLHPDDLPECLERWDKARDTNQSFEIEFRLLQEKDHSFRWHLGRALPIFDQDGQVMKWFGTNTDITQFKQLENQIRQSQKMEAIGTLAGGIAHDFNNILMAITGYTELATLNAKGNNAAQRNLEEVLVAGKRAKELVQQILAFSRQTDHEQQPIELKLVVKEVCKFLRASLPTTVEIRQNLAKAPTIILGDPIQMHQVVMNLCANAEYAMRESGGLLELKVEHVTVETDDKEIHPDLKGGSYVRLTVRDTGAGMTQDVAQRIFDPFFTTKGVGEGTGMGLAVVHGIVSSLGGWINVESESGQGTIFTIDFPEMEARSIQGENKSLQQEFLMGQGNILFVEDEEPLARLGEEAMKKLGYEVMVRTSSVEALEAFRADPFRFNAVVTDQTMPNMTGEALSRELLKIRPDLPIILCTGFSHSMTPEKAKAMGIRAYLLKPLLIKDLGRSLQEVLHIHKR